MPYYWCKTKRMKRFIAKGVNHAIALLSSRFQGEKFDKNNVVFSHGTYPFKEKWDGQICTIYDDVFGNIKDTVDAPTQLIPHSSSIRATDAVLGGRSRIPLGAAILGGEKGRKHRKELKEREFLALIKNNPQEAIADSRAEKIILDLIQKFKNHAKNEKCNGLNILVWRYSKKMKLRRFPSDERHIRILFKADDKYFYNIGAIILQNEFDSAFVWLDPHGFDDGERDAASRELLLTN